MVEEMPDGVQLESTDYEQKYLMCFVPNNLNLLHGVLRYLNSNMKVHENKVIVLITLEDNEERYLVVFKIDKSYSFNNVFHITVGEKPFEFKLIQTNSKSKHLVYYTLNALNYLIARETNVDSVEDVDRNHQIDWSKYKRSVIYRSGQSELKIVPTDLFGIINLNPKFDTPISKEK